METATAAWRIRIVTPLERGAIASTRRRVARSASSLPGVAHALYTRPGQSGPAWLGIAREGFPPISLPSQHTRVLLYAGPNSRILGSSEHL